MARRRPRHEWPLKDDMHQLLEELGTFVDAFTPEADRVTRAEAAGDGKSKGPEAIHVAAAGPADTAPPAVAVEVVAWTAPTLAVEPGARAWSAEAAMEPLPPLAPPISAPVGAAPSHAWVMTTITGVACAAALTIVLLTHFDVVSTSGPAQARTIPALQVNGLRATAALTVAGGPDAISQSQFSAPQAGVVLDATVTGAQQGDSLGWQVQKEPGTGEGAVTNIDTTVQPVGFIGDGHVDHAVTHPGGLEVGRYKASVLLGARILATTEFTVVATAPATQP